MKYEPTLEIIESLNDERRITTVTVRPPLVSVPKVSTSMLAQIHKTMADNPTCDICSFGFSKPITYCPNCGARR